MNDLSKLTKPDFPFFQKNPGVVYLDSAATSLTPRSVIDAIVEYYEESSSNIHRGVYKASQRATAVYEETRDDIIRFVNAPSGSTAIFLRNTTEGINLLAHSLGALKDQLKEKFPAWREGLQKGDIIVVSDSEHHSNIVPWQLLAAEKGLEIVYIPVADDGRLNTETLPALLSQKGGAEKVRIVSISQVSNVTGVVHDLKPIHDFARQNGAIFVVDGAQAICHSRVDLQNLDCDFFVFSAHKMLGPTGIGAIVGPKDLFRILPPYMGGGDMILEVQKDKTTYNEPPHKFEAGTPNVGGAYGLKAAIAYLEKAGMENIHAYEKELLIYAMEKMEERGIKMHGPSLQDVKSGKVDKVGVISFEIEGIHPHDIGTILDEHDICIRVGHHCCQLLMERWQVSATCRASFYLYNDKTDIDRLMAGIEAAQKVFRRG